MSDEGHVHVRGRRLPWSHWWWWSLAGLAGIVVMLFAPVSSGRVDCGNLLTTRGAPFERRLDYCQAAVSDRWLSIVTVTVLALIAFAVGLYYRVISDASPNVRVVVPILAVAVGLLLWPVDTPRGNHCGSVLLTRTTAVADRISNNEDSEFARCVAVRSNRIGWSVLAGVAALAVLSVRLRPAPRD
jgi:uncharacterized membrane protein